MKAILTMEIQEVKNKITKEMVKITDDFSEIKMFKKAVAKNLDKICKELEKYFEKQGIITKMNYYFEKKDER